MKNYIFLFLSALFLCLLFSMWASADASLCHTGYIGTQCCDGLLGPSHCVENVDWGYCGGNETYPNGDQPTNCTGSNGFWSDSCCCDGNVALSCSVPSLGGSDKRIWGNSYCGRVNAVIDCNGVANSHYVCNNTYYPTSTKCALMEPATNSYSVLDTSLALNENFSIDVSGTCPLGLQGKCLVECLVIHPDKYRIYVDSWSNESQVILPNVTCDKLGNYIVDYCEFYTDFENNNGWGNRYDANTTVSCLSSPEFDPPLYSFDGDYSGGSILEETMVNVYAKWEDSYGLGKAILRTNKGGSWQAYDSCSLTENSDWCNGTIDTTGSSGNLCWNQWANDTSNNLNNTMAGDVHCFDVIALPDTSPPTYSNDNQNSGDSVAEGTIVTAQTLWSDNKGLSSASILHNETGYWVVNSTPLSGTSQLYSFDINTAGYSGEKICWYQTANDTSDNLNEFMGVHCFSVTSAVESWVNIESPFETFRRNLSSSSTEFSIKLVELAFELLGIVVLVILLIILVQQLVQMH